MKITFLTGAFLCFAYFSNAQAEAHTGSTEIDQTRSEYVIGIGNESNTYYQNTLAVLKNQPGLVVKATCEPNHIISMSVNNADFKSYDVLSDFLTTQVPGILLFRKDMSIFEKDCKGEQLKP